MRVRAPATTANLGPGFDCLGAALSVSLEIDTSADEQLPKLVRRAISAAGGGEADARGVITSDIPTARGLGSSAACVAAGLLIGATASGRDIDRTQLLRLGTPIEGHPDNLAPALFGGITLSLPDGSAIRYEPAAGVRPMILVPRESLATKEARKVLPDDVPRADAIANAARTAGLLSMLTGASDATAERLLECTQDRLHQPYRAPLMERTASAIEALRAEGVAAAVSGAGPSVVCLVLRGTEQRVHDLAVKLDGWTLLDVDWNLEGVQIAEA